MLHPLLLLLAAVAGSTNGYQDPLMEPLQIECYDSEINFNIEVARITVDGQVSFNARLIHYEGKSYFPAPTIRAKAGTQCKVTIFNNLSIDTPISKCYFHENSFHCADTVNLHTHGLHASPFEDDVTTAIFPGESLTYTYNIIEEHMMGTNWYHTHYHGATTLQLLGGLAGGFIVDPADSYELPSDLQALYRNTRVMIFSHVYMEYSGVGFHLADYQDISSRFEYQTIDPDVEVIGETGDFFSVNGQYQPIVSLAADDATLLRVILAGGTRSLELSLDDPGGYCQMQLIARDGVFQHTPYMDINVIAVIQATRADVAVRCSSDGVGEKINVRASRIPELDVVLGEYFRHVQETVFSLEILPSSEGAGLSFPTSEASFPDYLQDLRGVSVDDDHQLYLELLGREINGVLFSGFASEYTPLYTLTLGEVYEVEMPMPYIPHGYHQHINHYQMLTSDDATGLAVREGEWRDTVPITNTRFRFLVDRFVGTQVIHCHIFEHEDEGMMHGMDIIAPDNYGRQFDSCAPDCPWEFVDDGTCHAACYVSDCFHDGADCFCACSGVVGDGICDEDCNTLLCWNDGGDCEPANYEVESLLCTVEGGCISAGTVVSPNLIFSAMSSVAAFAVFSTWHILIV